MGSRATVLIADDNDTDRFLLSAIIDAEGYDVISVADGQSAVEVFREHRPKIVLLDIQLPDIDGWEVAQQIKAMVGEAFVPIMFLVSLSEAEDWHVALLPVVMISCLSPITRLSCEPSLRRSSGSGIPTTQCSSSVTRSGD